MVNFQKKGLDKKKVFVVRDEALYFSEALGFSLPSLLVNPALSAVTPVCDEKQYLIKKMESTSTCCIISLNFFVLKDKCKK